jgi:cyclophilin family peptidyl-prolyl cis-trans isomerase
MSKKMSKKNQSLSEEFNEGRSNKDIYKDIAADGELNFKSDNRQNLPQSNPNVFEYLDLDFNRGKIIAIVIGIITILIIAFFLVYFIPNNILQQTDEARALRSTSASEEALRQKSQERETLLEQENKSLVFTNRSVNMKIKDFGEVKISLLDKAAPKNVENFIRLVSRKKYDNTTFHRMVTSPTFNVIQGGDYTTFDGRGGESATGQNIPDEIWNTAPEFDDTGKVKNNPEFRDKELYPNYKPDTQEVTYKKGLLLMANRGPDTNGSQFFITMSDTTLPARYTVFGKVEESSIAVLDKIQAEVKPIPAQAQTQQGVPEDYKDGKPDKELKIENISLI